VFKLTPNGLELVEVAPGIDIERDVLARMEFRPIIRNPAIMDQRMESRPRLKVRVGVSPCGRTSRRMLATQLVVATQRLRPRFIAVVDFEWHAQKFGF
jgi:hypothetical protein